LPRADLRKAGRALIPALAVLAADQGSKFLAASLLEPREVRPVAGFFNLVLVENTGAAFSLLAGEGPGQGLKMALLAVVAALPMIWLYRLAAAGERAFLAALGLVLGGAAGNVIDRLRIGAVVDFLDFHLGARHWPAFNAADIAVCVGVGMMALLAILGRGPAGLAAPGGGKGAKGAGVAKGTKGANGTKGAGGTKETKETKGAGPGRPGRRTKRPPGGAEEI
jgi:signal peptidase II